MATRFYLRGSGAPPISPAVSTGWDTSAAGFLRTVMSPTKGGTSQVAQGKVSAASSPELSMYAQLVSEPLAAQLLTGTMTGVIRANENNALLNATLAHCLRVVSGSGTHLAHLTGGGTNTINASTGTATPPEFATTNTSRVFRDAADSSTITLTNYTCAAGDCLVLELGCRDVDTGTSRSGELQIGDLQATDLNFDDVTTTATTSPWMELSMTVSFQGASPFHARGLLLGVGSVLTPTGLVLGPAWWRYRRMQGRR